MNLQAFKVLVCLALGVFVAASFDNPACVHQMRLDHFMVFYLSLHSCTGL